VQRLRPPMERGDALNSVSSFRSPVIGVAVMNLELGKDMSDWQNPPGDLRLDTHQVHIWRARLDPPNDAIGECEKVLSIDELARARHFLTETHGKSFIAAHGFLRRVLAKYLTGADAKQIELLAAPNGKPSLIKPVCDLRFNLSHSGSWAALAVCRGREIGIDIELIKVQKDADRIAERFFSQREREALRTLSGEMKREAFYRCWTRKEAFIKMTGAGLAAPLDQFDVSLLPGDEPRVIEVRDSRFSASVCSMQNVGVESSYAGAVAVEGEIKQISFYGYRW